MNAQYIKLLIIYLAAWIFVGISSMETFRTELTDKIFQHCFIGCKDNIYDFCKLTKIRGKNYLMHKVEPEKDIETKKCLASFWHLSHFLLYMLIGYLAPDMFWQSFFIGVLFEVYEMIFLDCHDALDIVFNTVGFFAGYSIFKWRQRALLR